MLKVLSVGKQMNITNSSYAFGKPWLKSDLTFTSGFLRANLSIQVKVNYHLWWPRSDILYSSALAYTQWLLLPSPSRSHSRLHPCQRSRLCHCHGLTFPVLWSRLYDRRADPIVTAMVSSLLMLWSRTLLRSFCLFLSHGTLLNIAKHAILLGTADAKDVRLLCIPQYLNPKNNSTPLSLLFFPSHTLPLPHSPSFPLTKRPEASWNSLALTILYLFLKRYAISIYILLGIFYSFLCSYLSPWVDESMQKSMTIDNNMHGCIHPC